MNTRVRAQRVAGGEDGIAPSQFVPRVNPLPGPRGSKFKLADIEGQVKMQIVPPCGIKWQDSIQSQTNIIAPSPGL